jgi:hypothetical protein
VVKDLGIQGLEEIINWNWFKAKRPVWFGGKRLGFEV